MMIVEFKKWVKEFKNVGCDLYCFYYEVVINLFVVESFEGKLDEKMSLRELIWYIYDQGMLVGIVIKLVIFVNVLFDLIESEDFKEKFDVS